MPRWLPLVITFIFIALVVYLADSRAIPGFFSWVDSIRGLDKLCHFTLMGGLAWCANYSLNYRRSYSLLTGSLIIAVIVTLEEGSQYFISTRTCDWKDLLADYLGIFIAGRCIPIPQSAIQNPQFK